MKYQMYEPNSIILQCRKYQEIIATGKPAEWADILGVKFADSSDLDPTFNIDFHETPKWWNKVDRATELHINEQKKKLIFVMVNDERAGLRLTEVKGIYHHGFFRMLIEKEFGRTSSLTSR